MRRTSSNRISLPYAVLVCSLMSALLSALAKCLPPPSSLSLALDTHALGEANSMSESKSKLDGMEHEGHLVAGSGTAEGYSREGSEVSHVADPTRVAKVRSLPPPPLQECHGDLRSRFV